MKNNLDTITVPNLGTMHHTDPDNLINLIEEKGVRRTIDSLDWESEYPYHPLTTFSIAHTDTMLYVDFFVRSNYLRAMNYQPNTPVYEDSSVGVFIQPDTTDGTYYSLMFNCIGTILGQRILPDGTRRLIDNDTLEEIKTYASCGTRPFRELEGLFSWNVIAEIPLSAVGVKYNGSPVTLKGNFVKCASGTARPHFLSWMPITTEKPDFFTPQFFGKLILE